MTPQIDGTAPANPMLPSSPTTGQIIGVIVGVMGASIGYTIVFTIAGALSSTWPLLLGALAVSFALGMLFVRLLTLWHATDRRSPNPCSLPSGELMVLIGLMLLLHNGFFVPVIESTPSLKNWMNRFVMLSWMPNAVGVGLAALGAILIAITVSRQRHRSP